jgi:hypothetical protein
VTQPRTPLIVVTTLLATLAAAAAAAGVVLRDVNGVSGQEFGACAAFLPDLDGDGRFELLVGSPSSNVGGPVAGRAYFWLGGTALTATANDSLFGLGGEEFGRAVAAIGDVNGDNVGDFAIGAPLADIAGADAGRVYVYYGGWPLSAIPPRVILEGRAAGEHFGHAIAAAGDFNGDGRDDLLVGAPLNNGAGIEAGAAYVYYGSAGGIATTPSLTLTGLLAYERFGWSVAGAGNMLGGPARCVVVGAPSNGVGALTREGRAFVFEGSTSPTPGPNTTADLTLTSSATSTADNEFGYAVANAGRWTSDSYDDIVVGAPYDNTAGSDAGRAEIFYGGASPDAVADRYVNGATSGDWLGFSVAGAGDVTGSGADDVILGAPHAVAGLGSEAGLAVLYAGNSASAGNAGSLPQVGRELLVAGTAPGDRFGWWVAGGGDFDGDGDFDCDFDGDGLDDYLVAAPAANITSVATAGWVQVMDSSGDSVPALLSLWDAAWTESGAQLRVQIALPVAHATLTRITVAGAQRTVVFDGAPPASDVWVFTDDGAAGAVVYDLALVFTDGGSATLAQLAGPVGSPPTVPLALEAPMPNPFNPSTSLRWRAPVGTHAVCRVVDVRGRQVRLLLDETASGAWHTLTWDGGDDTGRVAPAGVYLVRLETETGVVVRHAVLAK